jgi:hypothetical protein
VNEHAVVKCVFLQVIYLLYIGGNYITFPSSLLQMMVGTVLKLSSMLTRLHKCSASI